MFPDATCHHSEGWGPVSQLRPFDLTPCFEEAILFSVPLGSLIVLSLVRVFRLRQFVALQRTQKLNVRLLWGKLVRAHFNSGRLSFRPDRPTTT
jgi:ATP-binding cassette subfamily C (CFTR/MRP) protein 1